MKLSVKEKEMKANVKNNILGAAQFRYTEPAPLEVNLFAGKKRQNREEEKKEMDSEEEEA